MEEFQIWFKDLNPEAQRNILEFFKVKDYREMNWDSFPITVLIKETQQNKM